ncbi:flavodoxin [Paenibacillus rhizophilus]|uniref:Flavodoxin n=2 Tax=Paenibacillus rhizophilus TaxID=1850366 RepID=A0A3N9NZQ4_9BACL|nr:flavodoxin [Paenibacillus rhizophilus]
MFSMLMLFSLAACGGGNSTETVSNSGNTPPSTAPASAPVPTESIASSGEQQPEGENGKTLVAYFSRVGTSSLSEDVDAVTSASLRIGDEGLIGNTKVVVDMVQDVVDGDEFQIVTVEPYPGDFEETTDLALEQQKADARPELATHVENMDEYDVIFLGYPNWWGTIPMPVYTFLEEYDFSGKTIIPFITHDGSSLGRSVNDIRELAPEANILDGLAVQGNRAEDAQDEVNKWLQEIGIVN